MSPCQYSAAHRICWFEDAQPSARSSSPRPARRQDGEIVQQCRRGGQMIRTVAELLQEVLAAELPLLDESPVVHAPSIGAMYEGLSGKILSAAIPDQLGLRVVTG